MCWFKKKKKVNLREECRKHYGEDFLVLYDTIRRGGTIGNFQETITFLNMVEVVKKDLEEQGYEYR